MGYRIPSLPDRPWDPSSFLYNGYMVSFTGVKRGGMAHRAEVKERVELYTYFPSVPSWYVLGSNLPSLIPFK